ncbi:DUF4186 family protein [Nonomuraea sp. NPDC050556]|uniref:DUF4186 family protein n=1 Tax=Nonomuraea sp. NPDC050556 TaxID=3364369 RepID=UPI0037959BE3
MAGIPCSSRSTATCCRTCLARWHDIPAELGYVVEAICLWIVGQAEADAAFA